MIDADVAQLLRHNTRIIGEQVKLYYDELIGVGLTKKLAEKVAFEMYQQINRQAHSEKLDEALEMFKKQFRALLPDEDDDE